MATYNVTVDRAQNCAIGENIVIEAKSTVLVDSGMPTDDLLVAQEYIAELEAKVADLEARLIRALGDGATWRDRYQTLVAALK